MSSGAFDPTHDAISRVSAWRDWADGGERRVHPDPVTRSEILTSPP